MPGASVSCIISTEPFVSGVSMSYVTPLSMICFRFSLRTTSFCTSTSSIKKRKIGSSSASESWRMVLRDGVACPRSIWLSMDAVICAFAASSFTVSPLALR